MSFGHDHPGDNSADHEYVTEIDGAAVRISKVGGGTVGKAYVGHWHYTIVQGGAVSDRGSDLHTFMARTHAEAAQVLMGFTE